MYNKVVREDLTGKMTSEHKDLKEGRRGPLWIPEGGIPWGKNRQCKGPGVGACFLAELCGASWVTMRTLSFPLSEMEPQECSELGRDMT